MTKHLKIYIAALGVKEGDPIFCEFTGCFADDLHHISARGMGGDPQGKKDSIENLMAVTRHMHERCEGLFRPISREDQIEKHFEFLRSRGIEFNEKYFDEL